MVPLQPKPTGKAPAGTQEAAASRHQSLGTSVSDILPEKYHRVQTAWLGVRIQFQGRNLRLPPKVQREVAEHLPVFQESPRWNIRTTEQLPHL